MSVELFSTSKQHHINVRFVEGLCIDQIAEKIGRLSSPHVVIWYIGCYGLRKAGVEFYRDNLITPVFKSDSEATFWLTDLTAWNAFRKPLQSSIRKANGCSDIIEKLFQDKIRCIRSSHVFEKMQKISDRDTIDYFRTALRRDFIREMSNNFSCQGVSVGEIFLNNCVLMEDWYSLDVAKAYSLFQYLEGCLIVSQISSELIKNGAENDVDILFALPNDEIRYYKDESNSFQEDVNFLISNEFFGENLGGIRINVNFLSFQYGDELFHRPYNAPGKVIKRRDFSLEHLIDKNEIHRFMERAEYASL